MGPASASAGRPSPCTEGWQAGSKHVRRAAAYGVAVATARTDRSRPAPAGYRYVGPSSYAQAMDGRERREAQVRGKVQAFFDELRSALRRHVAGLDPDQLPAFASRLRAHARARKAQLEKKQDDAVDDTGDEGDFDPAAWDDQFQSQAAGWVQDSYDGAADDMGDEADLPDDATAGDDGSPSSSAWGRAAVAGLAVAGLWDSLSDSLDDTDPTDPQAALDAVDGAMDGLDDTTDLISTDIGIGASNAGSLMAAGNASIDLEKQWFTAQDELVRPSHQDLDGDIEPLDDEFANGLRYPGDEDGDIGEWINCRCTLLYLTPEGEETGESDTGEAPPEMSDMETAGLLLHLETQAFLQREAKQAELDVHASVGLYPRRTVEFKYSPDQPRGANGRFGDTDSGSLKDTQNSLIMHFDSNGEHTHSALREKSKGASGAWSVVDHRTGAKVTGIGSKSQAVNMLKSVTGAGKVSGGSKPAGGGAKSTGSTKQGPTFNPDPNPNQAERTATFDKISSHFQGPTDSSYGAGQDLAYKEAAVKRDTCDAIAKRMGDQFDDRLVVGKRIPYGYSTDSRAGSIYDKYATEEDKQAFGGYGKTVSQSMYDRMTDDERAALRSDMGIRQMVGNWAGSSNDKHDVTLALQETAIKEFGLERTRGWSQGGPGLKASIDANIQTNGDMYSSFLRSMYDNTQQELKDAGIKEMRLYRGFKSKIPTGGGEGRTVSFKLRPMSSYAYQQHTAQSFMGYGNNKGWGAAATVPADRILSTARTGFGCLNENEVVVLGGLEPQQTWTRTEATGQSTYTGYGGYQSYSGPEFKYSPDQARDDHGRFGEGDGDTGKDRRSEYATSTNTVDPRTGEKMSKTALGDAGEQAFEKVVAQDLHTVTGSKSLDNLNTEAGKRNVPLDFRSGTTGIEVKTISVDSRSQKAAISAEERQRKLDELPKIGADRAITVIQRYDPSAGSLEVRYHEGISSKSFNTATHIGSYDVGDMLR